MRISIVVLAISAAASAAEPAKVASTGFKAVSVDSKKVEFLSDYFAEKLGQAGHFRVTTQSEIAAVLGQERQKQLLGCSDDSSECLAEIAGAIGGEALITGSVARIGSDYALAVKIVRARDGFQLATASDTLGREEQLLPWLKDRADEMGPKIARALSTGTAGVTEASAYESPHPLRSKAVVPFVAGGLLIGGYGVFHALASENHDRLTGENSDVPNLDVAREVKSQGELYNTLGVVCAVTGAAAVATGLFFTLWPGSGSVSASVLATPTGTAVVFGGSF